MKVYELPPLDLLREMFFFNEETGKLFWKKITSVRAKVGGEAGHKRPGGYIRVSLNNQDYYAHRILYSLYYDKLVTPDMVIDHKNGVRHDNTKSNLVLTTQEVNLINSKLRTDSTTGHRGVSYDKRSKKYRAYININRKRQNLGFFNSLEEAISARVLAEAHNGVYNFRQ